jgi:hypothetical protein
MTALLKSFSKPAFSLLEVTNLSNHDQLCQRLPMQKRKFLVHVQLRVELTAFILHGTCF